MQTGSLQTGTYEQFSRSIHQHYFGSRAPLDVTLELTHRCPLACQHCYNNLPMGDGAARRREMSTEEYFALLDDLAELGTLWLLFTGGEIFARKDFLQIYQHAKERGFIVTLFTNGTMVNERIADFLTEWPPFNIEITLYGRSKEVYEQLTGIPGSYERCLRGIRLLRERGLPLKLKTVPTTINQHEVFAMKRFAEEELGLEFKFDPMVNPRIDCSQSPLAVRLSPEQVVALDLADPKRCGEYRRLAERDFSNLSAPLVGDNLYVCGGGVNSFAVDPYGQMSICLLSRRQTYDLRAGSVREGWERFLRDAREARRTRPTKCRNCRLHSLCGMCPAQGELENGDPESPVDFLCQVAHLRAQALGLAVPEHGECECCAGGKYHAQLVRAVERIRQSPAQVETDSDCSGSFGLLPILNNAQAEPGHVCSGCGTR